MRSGQVVIVILLILAVVLTVGLTMVTRSVTEVSTSTTQEESARALEAAEAGIEAKLGGLEVQTIPGATYNLTATDFGNNAQVSLVKPLVAGDVTTVFLSQYDLEGQLQGVGFTGSKVRVCWGQDVISALESSLYYLDATGTPKVLRSAFDADPSSRGNNFTQAGDGVGCPTGKTYVLSGDIDIPSSPAQALFLRLKLLYNGSTAHYVSVVNPNSDGQKFPIQGQNVVSAGSAGNTSRKLEVFQGTPDNYPIFENAVYSGTDLAK